MDRTGLDKELKQTISKELKRIRKETDCSIERMAEKIGLEYTTLYNIYSGRNLPGLITLIQISKTFSIPIEFWFRSIAELTSKKKEAAPANMVDLDVLRIFNKLDKETKEVILRVLKGYTRTPRYDVK